MSYPGQDYNSKKLIFIVKIIIQVIFLTLFLSYKHQIHLQLSNIKLSIF